MVAARILVATAVVAVRVVVGVFVVATAVVAVRVVVGVFIVATAVVAVRVVVRILVTRAAVVVIAVVDIRVAVVTAVMTAVALRVVTALAVLDVTRIVALLVVALVVGGLVVVGVLVDVLVVVGVFRVVDVLITRRVEAEAAQRIRSHGLRHAREATARGTGRLAAAVARGVHPSRHEQLSQHRRHGHRRSYRQVDRFALHFRSYPSVARLSRLPRNVREQRPVLLQGFVLVRRDTRTESGFAGVRTQRAACRRYETYERRRRVSTSRTIRYAPRAAAMTAAQTPPSRAITSPALAADVPWLPTNSRRPKTIPATRKTDPTRLRATIAAMTPRAIPMASHGSGFPATVVSRTTPCAETTATARTSPMPGRSIAAVMQKRGRGAAKLTAAIAATAPGTAAPVCSPPRPGGDVATRHRTRQCGSARRGGELKSQSCPWPPRLRRVSCHPCANRVQRHTRHRHAAAWS